MKNKPKKHRLVVDITDMELGYSTKRVKQIVSDALDTGLHMMGHDSFFAGIKVKDFKRVETYLKRKEK